jgi:intracellular sulfur oxidation DsrE/DsrF family protein
MKKGPGCFGTRWKRSPANRSRPFLAGALAALALVVCVAVPVQSSAEAVPQRNRIVIQVSDGDAAKWNLALNNARNLQADLGAANVEIEIVAYGPGLGMLKRDSAVATRVDEALSSGVKVVACENTMRAQKLTQPDMLASIGYVGAGVVEIMQRQQQGWSYLRP